MLLAFQLEEVHAAIAVSNDDGSLCPAAQFPAGSGQVSESGCAHCFTAIGLEHYVTELANSLPRIGQHDGGRIGTGQLT